VKVALVFAAVLALPLLSSHPAWAVACTSAPTLADWEALGSAGCTDTDKIYRFISNGPDTALPGTTGFTVGTVPLPPSSALHTVAFNFGVTLAPGTYSIEYTINITTQTPQPTFGSVNIDTTVPQNCPVSPCNAIKNIFESNGTQVITNLQSDNGVPSGTVDFPAGLTFIDVRETFFVPAGGVMSGATNTYTELNVPQTPEPASLILLGLGLVGAGVLRRKMKAA